MGAWMANHRSNGAYGVNGRRPSRRPPPRRSPGPAFLAVCVAALAASSALGAWIYLRGQPQAPDLRSLVTRSFHRLNLRGMVSEPPPPTLLTGGSAVVHIIMYHDVTPRKEVWFDMTTREFRRQMDDLEAAGAHPIPLQTLYDHLLSGKPVPPRSIVLTFDDCTLGQFTDALPILQSHRFPAVFFVQTKYVGKTTSKQHMSWDQLRQAEATGLVTVESHTVTHPENITLLSDRALKHEMEASRAVLEKELRHPIRFLAYPSGNCDARVAEAASKAGYLAAVTMDRGWASSPAQSYFLPRFAPARVQDVLNAWEGTGPIEPPLPRLASIQVTPLQSGAYEGSQATIDWVDGGDLGTQSLNTRKTVGELALAAGAQAALNGTFFADARVQSEGSAMVGPVLSRVGATYKPDTPSDEPRIAGRPLLLIGDHRCLILPFEPHLGGSLDVLKQIMPDVKDAFVAGGWIVHNGHAEPPEQIRTWSTADANDPRHRAFVGIDGGGHYILGATQQSVSTSAVAQTAEEMKIQEAFLLDSGFSTSLIWQNHVLVSGHSRKDVPSRPVPHALFLLGPVAANAAPPPPDSPLAAGAGAASAEEALSADSTAGAARYTRRRHRRHRFRPMT